MPLVEMADSLSLAQSLIQQPKESLAIELKAWIDPDSIPGKSKIVKAALALRNNNGGHLLIGFDNATGEPSANDQTENVRQIFELDKIQGMISKYASGPFEIVVDFPERDGMPFPVISIPAGIKSPVVCKSDLKDRDKFLLRADTVYARSLSSNNTVSSTQAKAKDWERIMDVCFDNREADIGRFLRRHIGLANSLQTGFSLNSIKDELSQFRDESEDQYYKALGKKKISNSPKSLWEVSLVITGKSPSHFADRDFLRLLSSNNPNHSGWPVWQDSHRLGEQSKPYVLDGAWEALVMNLGPKEIHYFDFMRMSPEGKFFLIRALEEDWPGFNSHYQPGELVDISWSIKRVAETMAVGIAFAKAMEYEEETTLSFSFSWKGLEGRRLTSFPNSEIMMFSQNLFTRQDEVSSFVNLELNASLSSLSQYVELAVKPLFSVFEGYVLSSETIDSVTKSLLSRCC